MQTTNVEIITTIQTKPRPKFARIGKFINAYTPKTALTYERYIASEYQRLGGKYYKDKPLHIEMTFYFKMQENTPKYKKYFCEMIPNTNHKDLDNLAKSVLDALNGIAYDDDRQVDYLVVSKQWTTLQERISILIVDKNYETDKELKEKYKNEIKK